MKRLLSWGVCIFVLGCATLEEANFYGVRITQSVGDKAFQIYNFAGQNVTHSSGGSISGDVEAWAQVKPKQIIIKMKNKMAKSIYSDYFFDKFFLVMKNGLLYTLKKQEPVSYRHNVPEDIKPGEKATFILEAPVDVSEGDIEKIVCEIGVASGARLVLKHLPQVSAE